ncbi:MAG TPA: protein-methionine-sulfoxide reductase heme-binding subunit MsrQ [Roseiflexaceae bacterium]|nr:protein-methionine-sulfoxide reductase heme-binding subunit MsrQ [Roseiflexaceae bacterium]
MSTPLTAQQTPATRRRERWPLLVHTAALLPLLVAIADLLLGRLTVNPIQDLTHRSGYTALVLLVASLACTPISMVFGFKRVLTLRRPLGLYGFGYALVHMLIFVVVDFGLDITLIWQEVAEKRYILAGMAALLLLIPLAITSTSGWQRRLGRRWRLVHRLVYLAVPLAVIHYIWLVKADIREPLLYAALVILLLLLRLGPLRRAITTWRRRLSS